MPRKFEMKIFWKFAFLKFEMKKLKLSFLKFEMKFSVWNLKKKSAISLEGNEKKWNEEIIYHPYNTPIPPMYITLYHRCKLWWYTVNHSRQILSYWSFFNRGIWWYGPP
jgi:hypothetical protein